MIAALPSLLLTLSMIGQYNVVKPFWPVPAEVKNMAFEQVQEEWIFQTKRGPLYRWDDVMSRDEADLLAILDAEKVAFRRFGHRYIKEMGFKASKLCAWGVNAKSAELKEACNNHLVYLYRCTYCNGTGKVRKKIAGYNEYDIICNGCKESGSFFWYMRYNLVEGEYEWAQRDIFGPTEKREMESE
mgnify:CR=1 FL=1